MTEAQIRRLKIWVGLIAIALPVLHYVLAKFVWHNLGTFSATWLPYLGVCGLASLRTKMPLFLALIAIGCAWLALIDIADAIVLALSARVEAAIFHALLTIAYCALLALSLRSRKSIGRTQMGAPAKSAWVGRGRSRHSNIRHPGRSARRARRAGTQPHALAAATQPTSAASRSAQLGPGSSVASRPTSGMTDHWGKRRDRVESCLHFPSAICHPASTGLSARLKH